MYLMLTTMHLNNDPSVPPQEVLDPAVGQEVLAELRKEIHRLQLRHQELLRSQERLVVEMERAVEKRYTISVKARVDGLPHKHLTYVPKIGRISRHSNVMILPMGKLSVAPLQFIAGMLGRLVH